MGIEPVSRPSRLLAGSLPRFGKKGIIASVAAAVAAGVVPSAHAEIELGEGLSVAGFVDMSFLLTDPDGGSTTKVFGVDQVEMDFMYAGSDGISAQVDFELADASDQGNESNVEQAFITKKFSDQFSMKAGRFLSYSGWEAQEPTGLYQYSAILNGYQQSFYGYYQNGLSGYYSGGKFDLMASVVADTFDPTDSSFEDMGFEVGAAFKPFEGLTAKVFYIQNTEEGADDEDTIVNAWVSYAMGSFLFAGEYSTRDFAGGGDADGYMVMGNYTSGPMGFTVRYHDVEDYSGITVSPSYKVGSNLLLVGEVRMDDFDGSDVTTVALEALFTF